MNMDSKTNIAAVDDSKEILEIIEHEFINDREYKFKFYSDGNKFLDDLTDDVDLVVMDIHMPDFDVIKAVERVDEVSPMAYVIVISGDKDFAQLVELTNMGIFRFCEKDAVDFLINLRKYIKAAHRKVVIRKGLLKGNGN